MLMMVLSMLVVMAASAPFSMLMMVLSMLVMMAASAPFSMLMMVLLMLVMMLLVCMLFRKQLHLQRILSLYNL